MGGSGTVGKAEGADRDDRKSTDVAMPSRQLADDAPTIARVMSEQHRGGHHLEPSTSDRDRYGTPCCHHLRQSPVRGRHQPRGHADGSRAAQAVVTA
jgi:hypothetical protein